MEDLREGSNLKQLSNYSISALAAFTLYPRPTSPVLHCGSREPGTEPVQHSYCLSGVVQSKVHCCWFGGVFSGFLACACCTRFTDASCKRMGSTEKGDQCTGFLLVGKQSFKAKSLFVLPEVQLYSQTKVQDWKDGGYPFPCRCI